MECVRSKDLAEWKMPAAAAIGSTPMPYFPDWVMTQQVVKVLDRRVPSPSFLFQLHLLADLPVAAQVWPHFA